LIDLLKFANANKLEICVVFAKNHGWQRNWGVRAKLRGRAVRAPRPEPKTATGQSKLYIQWTSRFK